MGRRCIFVVIVLLVPVACRPRVGAALTNAIASLAIDRLATVGKSRGDPNAIGHFLASPGIAVASLGLDGGLVDLVVGLYGRRLVVVGRILENRHGHGGRRNRLGVGRGPASLVARAHLVLLAKQCLASGTRRRRR